MRGIFLYGLNCKPWIWDDIKYDLRKFEIEYVEYPKTITKNCTSVADLSMWVYETYLSNNIVYDFILGHSMGGLIALHLSMLPNVHINKTIFIESFLKPTEPFYRNLIMESNKSSIGDKVFAMLKEEDSNYTKELKSNLKENFDYTEYLERIHNNVYGIYGNRGNKEYPFLLRDLNLTREQLDKINISFVANSCHLPMLENPHELAQRIISILQ